MLYTLKEALNLGLVFKKVPRFIKFNQEALLKPYINMNTELRKNENHFGKKLIKFDGESSFWKNFGK